MTTLPKFENVQGIIKLAHDRKLKHLTLGCFDWEGRLRAKHYHVGKLEKALTDGIGISTAIFATDPAENSITTGYFDDPNNGYRDATLRIDAETCRTLPFEDEGQGLLLFGQLTGDDAVYCPRSILARELACWHELGIEIRGALELECYLLDERCADLQHKVPKDLKIATGFERMYSFVDQAVAADVYAAIKNACHETGITIASLHSEFTGLLEVALAPKSGLTIADDAALYKSVAKIVARRFDMMAVFMARLSSQHESAGAHINVSMWARESGQSLLFDTKEDGAMSSLLRFALAGLQRYTPELFLFHCPYINSYKRLTEDSITPRTNTWGIDNKTTAFRVITTDAASARIEFRVPGADVNPYLSLAAFLAAARAGVENQWTPSPECSGNAWVEQHHKGPNFPSDFVAAIVALESSQFANGVFGKEFISAFAHSRRWQWQQFSATVTDWELHNYAECV